AEPKVDGWRPAAATTKDPKYALSELAYQRILASVIEGRFPVGSKLPAETDLARELGICRPVLRAALVRLRADGILASRQGSGNFVIRQPHQTVLRFAPLSRLTDIQDCFKFRIGIEGEAAYFAALNHDARDLAAIDVAFEELEVAAETGHVGVDADFRFHLRIAQASGNPYFVSALDAIREQIVFGISLTRRLSLRRSLTRLRQVQDEHHAIRETIRRREVDHARTMMREHLEKARRRVYEGDLEPEAPFDTRAADSPLDDPGAIRARPDRR